MIRPLVLPLLAVCLPLLADGVSVSVSVEGPVTGRPIPSNFAGLSIEVQSVPDMLNTPMWTALQTLRNLSHAPLPTILRFGGNSADRSCYGGGSPLCTYNITSDDLAQYVDFAKKGGVKYVIDTNFGISPDPALGVRHVQALKDHGVWGFVDSIEVGNEMDLYAKHPENHHRNASYTYSEYLVEFAHYVKAYGVGKMIRGAVYAGERGDWGTGFASYLASNPSFKSVSLHQYPTSTCGGVVPLQDILGRSSSQLAVGRLARYINDSMASHVPFWVGEGNTASCGGQEGMSNTFASTLWALDYLPYLSQAGAVGMNFHGGPKGPYAVLAFDGQGGALDVRPVFYGLLGFTELVANGSVWLSATAAPTAYPGGDPYCKKGQFVKGHTDVCCPASCTVCGGPGCAGMCCETAIISSNRSCNTEEAPCVVDKSATEHVDVHAVRQPDGVVRVMLIAKRYADVNSTTAIAVDVCIPSPAASTASLVRITAPSVSATSGLSYAGQTFDSTGRLSGARVTQPVTGRDEHGKLCYAVSLPVMSAALLTVPPHTL